MVGKGSKNSATAPRTASEKDAGKMDEQRAPPSPQSPHVFSLAFPSSRLSPLSERLEQASKLIKGIENARNVYVVFS